jgi:hypothetical protein
MTITTPINTVQDEFTNTMKGWRLFEISLNHDVGNKHLLNSLIENTDREWFTHLNPITGSSAVRIGIINQNSEWICSAIVAPAEDTSFHALSGKSKQYLTRSIWISDITINYPDRSEVLPCLLYLALRRGRIWGRKTIVTYVNNSVNFSADFLGLEKIENCGMATNELGQCFVAMAQRLDIALHNTYIAASPEIQSFLRLHFVAEVVEALDLWISKFFQTAWFKSIYQGTLTRQQYIYTLSNTYQYVRFTTRLIGRAVSLSDNSDLRRHWLNHLQGEIDHEVIIESDLNYLSADVKYVINSMLATNETQEFIVAQESILGFQQDPVIFLAAPFVAEGFSANLDANFLAALEANAKNWGVQNPKLVTKFLASHINYDGGDDGHWEQTRVILSQFLIDNTQIQRFLNMAHLTMNSFERSYNAYVEDLEIFQ